MLLLVAARHGLRRELELGLKESQFDLAVCDSPRMVNGLLARQRFCLVLIDLQLAEASAMELCVQIPRSFPGTEIVLVSDETTPKEIVDGFACGAADVITGQHLQSGVLQARLNRVIKSGLGTKSYVSSTEPVIRHGPFTLYSSRYAAYAEGRPLHLTAREFLVLSHLVSNSRRVATRRDLVHVCGKHDQDVSDRAVDNLILRLRRKLGRWGSQIVSIRGIGYTIAELSDQ